MSLLRYGFGAGSAMPPSQRNHTRNHHRLFDAYLAVDWSAASSPKRGADSIWLCKHGLAPENPSTREEATERVRELLRQVVAAGQRVLVGFDFPNGYPRGFADLVAPGDGPPWRRTWDALVARVRDEGDNANNRFEVAAELNVDAGPFWGCPGRKAQEALTVKRGISFPHHGLPEFRAVERAVGGLQSAWKLYGAGSVGSQALLGIPRVASLRDDPELAPASAVWPFEPTLLAQVVHVEIWPGLVEPTARPVRDAGQVEALVRQWACLDEAGELGARFAAPPSSSIEEGWIFGVVE
jgi:precorrin-8X/cobalt-precorrin-8 methylmutase